MSIQQIANLTVDTIHGRYVTSRNEQFEILWEVQEHRLCILGYQFYCFMAYFKHMSAIISFKTHMVGSLRISSYVLKFQFFQIKFETETKTWSVLIWTFKPSLTRSRIFWWNIACQTDMFESFHIEKTSQLWLFASWIFIRKYLFWMCSMKSI